MRFISLFTDAFSFWNEDNVQRLSAALAFFTILSLPPLFTLIISGASIFFEQSTLRSDILYHLSATLGQQSTQAIEAILKNTYQQLSPLTVGITGILLLFGAAGIFTQLKDSLNTIWDVKEKKNYRVSIEIHKYLLSFAMIGVLFFLLVVSLTLNALVTTITPFFQHISPIAIDILSSLFSFLVLFFVFSFIFKVLPDVIIPWKPIFIGALTTTLLFMGGQMVLGIFFDSINLQSAYGVFASLIAILLWLFFSAQILFFGAEVSKTYALSKKITIQPDSYVTSSLPIATKPN